MFNLTKTGLQNKNNPLGLELQDKESIPSLIYFFLEDYFSVNTKKTYGKILANFFTFMNVVTMDELKTKYLNYPNFVNEIRSFFYNYKAISSQKLAHGCLKKFWEYLVDIYFFPKNPVRRIRFPAITRKSNTPSLTEEELKQLLFYLKDCSGLGYTEHLTYILVFTLASTCLRISEVLQITVEMVNNDMLKVQVKGGRLRELELPFETKKAILDFCNKYKIYSDVIFLSPKRKKVTRHYAYYLIRNVTKKKMCCHSFRKTIIELLIKEGCHSHEVAKVSGHKSIDMVFYYDNRTEKTEIHKKLIEKLYKK